MTKKDSVDYLLKTLITISFGICAYFLQNAVSDLRELRSEVKSLQNEIIQQTSELKVQLAYLKTRMDYHEKVQ